MIDFLLDCSGLPAEWRTKLETTTQFPVISGTVVELTCLDPETTLNVGSSHVTCTSDTIFSYEIEPRCSGNIKYITNTTNLKHGHISFYITTFTKVSLITGQIPNCPPGRQVHCPI